MSGFVFCGSPAICGSNGLECRKHRIWRLFEDFENLILRSRFVRNGVSKERFSRKSPPSFETALRASSG